MSDLKSQIELTADATGVETGVSKAKQSLASLGAAASAAGKEAAQGLNGMGQGGDGAAKKVDRATQNIINSIQRTTATMEAGSRTGSKYFETLAGQRGIDTSVLKPYLDQLDAVNAKSKAAADALNATNPAFKKYEMSAKATAAALRGVPAQFTDIVTSLQGGQAPLTVFLQQGGQLKDMFGGVGNAAKALGGYVLGLISPFTLAASAVALLGFAYFQGSKEAEAYSKAIILSGNAAGLTSNQLQAMAQRIDGITGTQAAAAEALTQFAASGQIAGANIERFTLIALKMEKETGQAIKETVKQFEELGKSPVEASAKLNQSTNYLTASIYEQIRSLQEQGRWTDAAALAQKSYADAMDSRLTQVTSNLGYVERAWRSVASTAKDAWDKMLGIGRTQTSGDRLSAINKQIADIENEQARSGFGENSGGAAFGGARSGSNLNAQRSAELQSLKAQAAALGGIAYASEQAAKAEGERAAKNKASIDAQDKIADLTKQFATNQEKANKELKETKQLFDKIRAADPNSPLLKNEKGLLDDIREKYRDKGAAKIALGIDKAQLGLDLEAIKAAAEQLTGTYANAEKIMEALRSAGLVGDHDYYESKRSFLELENKAKEDAFQKEIARLQREKFTGKDKLDNDKKIAEVTSQLAILRANASAQLVTLSIQEEAAGKRLELSYLSARQAAQDYFDTLTRQQDRDLSGLGQGTQKRNFNTGINQIEDRYSGQRRDNDNLRAQLELEGKFTEEARVQYHQRLDIINEFEEKSLDTYKTGYDKRMKIESDWSAGAHEALTNYFDTANNIYKQTEDAVSSAFKGMEDALVKFVTTGKLSYTDLANSIVADITRIIIKQQIANAMASLMGGGSSGGSGAIGLIGSVIGAFSGTSGVASAASALPGDSLDNMLALTGNFAARAIGGPVSQGGMYQVNEKGPELLNVAGKSYLMMGDQSGSVTPNSGLSSGNTVNVTVNQSFAPGTTKATTLQAAADASRQLSYAGRNL